jgi:protoheme IX farnesyltransferase
MRRTENRPLPAGRLQPVEVLLFGLCLGVAGVAYLAFTLKQPWTALLAAFTFVSYVWIYTPLKRLTPLNTLVGAIPGAMPPVLGWTAVHGFVGMDALVLFLIVFFWQVPHFLAIAWIYRDDYARAGLQMLPVVDRDGRLTSRHMLSYCVALLPASLAPGLFGLTGPIYLLGAVVLGLGFTVSVLGFTRNHTIPQARRVLRASLVYLPALLALWLVDGVCHSVALALWP